MPANIKAELSRHQSLGCSNTSKNAPYFLAFSVKWTLLERWGRLELTEKEFSSSLLLLPKQNKRNMLKANSTYSHKLRNKRQFLGHGRLRIWIKSSFASYTSWQDSFFRDTLNIGTEQWLVQSTNLNDKYRNLQAECLKI